MIHGFIVYGIGVCVYTKDVAVKRGLRFGETLSVVEDACCALWIAQGHAVFTFTASCFVWNPTEYRALHFGDASDQI